MRIVGGKFAGRDLVSPNEFRVRPTAELVRAAMLDRLAHVLTGAHILDLFAGTGALGLEALSRGAASADFVETRRSSLGRFLSMSKETVPDDAKFQWKPTAVALVAARTGGASCMKRRS